MQTLRKTKNIRGAQMLLGHANIKSIMVYARAIQDDVHNALAMVHADCSALETVGVREPELRGVEPERNVAALR